MSFFSDYGKQAEDLALEYYQNLDCVLICKNFQYYQQGTQGRLGEIDLIMQKENYLILVEVKANYKSNEVLAAQRVTRKKLLCLWKTYQYFIQKNPKYRDFMCKFDVALVLGQTVKIIPNAYSFENL
jgi:putative endonuclease